jgi:hypothetical protein
MVTKNSCSYCALPVLTFAIVRYDQSAKLWLVYLPFSSVKAKQAPREHHLAGRGAFSS